MKRCSQDSSIKKKSSPIFIAVGLVIIAFLLYGCSIYYLIPSSLERGLFGDSFGALNTLISGIALIGVIYALFLQHRQLHEMQRSLGLQQQPMLSVDKFEFEIDRPAVFTSPSSPVCEALSRFHCALTLKNISEIPAINIIVSTILIIPLSKDELIINSIGEHFPVISGNSSVDAKTMLVPQVKRTALFQVLRKKDAYSLPRVQVEFVYRNLLGTCFRVRQALNIIMKDEIEEDLKAWHTAISSFSSTFQEELSAMEKNYSVFDKIKKKFNDSICEKKYLSLQPRAIPGEFDVSEITSGYYENFINAVGLPRLTFPHSSCPRRD
jgi:hypothetical protein